MKYPTITRFRRLSALLLLLLPALLHGDVEAGDYGLAGDGQTNDAPAIQRALDYAAANHSGRVLLPAGTFFLTESLRVPSHITLEGAGRRMTVLEVPQGADFEVIVLQDVKDTVLRNFSLVERDSALGSQVFGISLRGRTTGVLVEDVHTHGFMAGFGTGQGGEGDGIRNVVFRQCHAEAAAGSGFYVNRAAEILIEDCYAFRNNLSGIKLLGENGAVTIRGGESSYNGIGVDAYAGGKDLLIEDLLVEGNTASGVCIQSVPSDDEEAAAAGRIRISGVRAYRNHHGLDINGGGGEGTPPVADMVVIGGIYANNLESGIHARGRNISLVAPIVRNNSATGIDLVDAWDVALTGVLVSGNGTSLPGAYPGVWISASGAYPEAVGRVSIQGGVINGIGSDDVMDDFAVDDISVFHAAAIHIDAGVSDVVVDSTIMVHYTGDQAIDSDMDTGASLIVHYGIYGGDHTVGGPGSSRVRNGQLQVKTTDVTYPDGWQDVTTMD